MTVYDNRGYSELIDQPHMRNQSMAYALILKDVGALYQQMYLVATAMNLAPCGLERVFSRALLRIKLTLVWL